VSTSRIATVYCLFYGDYPKLHKRLGDSLRRCLPPDQARLVLWANQPCQQTQRYLTATLVPAFVDTFLHISSDNVPKYRAMRRLFHELAVPETPWLIWFDDDTHIVNDDWWSRTLAFANGAAEVQHFGKLWYIHYTPKQLAFIRTAAWYRGVPFEEHPTRTRNVMKPGIRFANGAYWWLSTDVMRAIDWPDIRLNHNGGDTLLSEALRQNGIGRFDFSYGIRGNDAPRRGFHEKPAGA
jgi:hypothetical protein